MDVLPGVDEQGLEANFFAADPAFGDLMEASLGDAYAWARPLLEDMGRMAARTLPPLSEDANRNPPTLVQYDALGNRIDEVRVHPSYREMTRLGFGAGIAGLFYDPEMRRRHGYVPHSLVFGLGYLFAQAEQGLYCPICMTEGAARVLDQFADADLKARYLPRLTARDLDSLLEGAMLLTEKQGGSDVGANQTVARRVGDHWELYGDKWFCSNAGEAGVMLVLARPAGAPSGTKGLGLFLMPRDLPDGSRNRFRINRLKDKLGTRSMPSGEFTLDGAVAYAVGDVSHGFRYMTEMLNLSRIYNAVASVSLMRRATFESVSYAHTRTAFGRAIDQYPMLRKQLVGLTIELEASVALVWEAIRLLDAQDQGRSGDDERRVLRLLTPMIKFHTGRQAVRFASEACEVLGGNGYIETFITPRLLRDAQVLPIWEGTTNILVLDVLRSLSREGAGPALMAMLRGHLGTSRHEALAPWRERLETEIRRLERAMGDLAGLDEALVTMHARTWADRAIRTYEAVLLLTQAERELTERAGGRKLAMLKLHVERFLTPVAFGEPGWCAERAPDTWFDAIVRHAPLPAEQVR